MEIFHRLNTLEPGAVGAEELTPEELPFVRFEAAAQELFDGWRANLESSAWSLIPTSPHGSEKHRNETRHGGALSRVLPV